MSLESRQAEPWRSEPPERDPLYFRTWQRVSVALQKSLRSWIPKWYFDDLQRFEDRDSAHQFLVYAACRPCFGRPRTEFTYDLADVAVLDSALYNVGRSLQTVLRAVEIRLSEAGMPELGRRYSPVWNQDIQRAVKRNPKRLIGLLAAEAKVVNAVIDLGTTGDAARFDRIARAALRSIAGDDMRQLAYRAVDEAVRLLADAAFGEQCGAGLQPARRFETGATEADYKSAAGCKPAPRRRVNLRLWLR
jgi:hypothetical protein